MRIVRQGTETKLYWLQENDLPADHDLSGSFLKWVDLSGFDLSGYNCQWMDIHDCDCRNVILPENIDFTVSMRSDWTDAVIPKSMPFCAFQMIGEVLRRHTAPPGSREEGMIHFVMETVDNAHNDSRNPWLVSNYHFKVDLGLTSEQICEVFERYAFGQYPNLLRMLRQSASADPDAVYKKPVPFIEAIDPKGKEGTFNLPNAQVRPFGTEDRWAAARMTEQLLNQRFKTTGWQAVVFFLVPEVWAVILHESRADGEWWRHAWPL